MLQITNEDNMELMSRYKDNHFDLAIVDPPYGIGESNKKRENTKSDKWNNPTKKIHNVKEWDCKTPEQNYFDELQRVSKHQIIWGANYMIDKIKKPSMGWIFWDKKNGDSDFSDGELAYTSFKKGLRKFEWLWNGFQKQRPEIKIHPTQKPVKLYEWLLMNYAKEGYRILDTHLGSGSIAIACHNLKFDLTACELDKEYYKTAMKRINEHKQQIRLF
ncbi:MAG: site-specific DNA-methyltransferase [Flavobacteriales bacterium]|nr:site-specific DNA-methyltransferase [Flavobacteriales bacterium]